MILVILGGTCSGKTEFALSCEKYGFPKVITNTTRARRVDDKEDSYHFLTKEEFFEKVENGEMIEYAEYNGNYYGTSSDSLSKNCVVVLEPNGLRSLKNKIPDGVFSIYLWVSEEERLRRGLLRGDNPEIIKSRIEEDKVLFNDNLENEVSFVIRDLKREEYSEVIENNFEVLWTE